MAQNTLLPSQINILPEPVIEAMREEGTLDLFLDMTYTPIRLHIDTSFPYVLETARNKGADIISTTSTGLILYKRRTKKIMGYLTPGVGTGIIAINPENPEEIVLTKRKSAANNRAGLYELPGGTVEFGDSLDKTCEDELYQETGLTGTVLGYIKIDQDFVEKQHWISFAGVMNITGGTLHNAEPHKFEEVSYYPLDNLPQPLSLLSKRVIENYINKVPFIPIGTIMEDKP
ncbi:MAG: NUDIX domain-containing protein [Candidatus Nanoarchaeia archaeon]